MKKEIEVLGRPIKIAFNMAVQIAYEDITGRAFNILELNSRKASLALYTAAILVNNPDTDITIDKLMQEMTFDDLSILDKTLSELMADWFKIPEAIKKEEQQGESNPS